ncbi:MAG: response regulator [Bdellovibrionales bacterium]|nr:response regulator [Bdellovibrionales bacterium]
MKENICLQDIIKDTVGFSLSGSCSSPNLLLPTENIYIYADKGQISQVFQNLVINASQAMPNGGSVEISIEKVDVTTNHTLPLHPGEYFCISVSDQGVGINAEDQKNIFDPYFSTENTGRGLGLATVHSVIKNHGGHVLLESSSPQGSVFKVFLPNSETSTSKSNSKGNVLVMDDDLGIRELVNEILNQEMYNVLLCKNGEEALEAFNKKHNTKDEFDFVLLDLTIPGGMGGLETLKRLSKIDPNIKAIVASGYADDSVLANFRDHGFIGMVKKPFCAKDLLKTIEEVKHIKG